MKNLYIMILGVSLIFMLYAGGFGGDKLFQDTLSTDSSEYAHSTALLTMDDFGEKNFKYYSSPIRSISVTVKGKIDFSDNEQSITGISDNGYFKLSERRWFTTRQLEVLPGKNGNPEFRYRVRSKIYEFDEEAQAWLGDLLPEVLESTGINAHIRINEHLSKGNFIAAVEEISRLGSSSRKREYYTALAEKANLPVSAQLHLVKKAGESISSSSSLRSTLHDIAPFLSDQSSITVAMFEAAQFISSSSERASALITTANSRQMDKDACIAMANSAQSISSSSELSRTLQVLAKYTPLDNKEVVEAYMDAAMNISSSSELGNVLSKVSSQEGLNDAVWIAIANAVPVISSSSEKGRVLRTFAAFCSNSSDVISAYLQAASNISSSSELGSVLRELLANRQLSEASYIEFYQHTPIISSSSEKGAVLREAALTTPITDAAVNAFLEATASISSSSEKEYVLEKLLTRGELNDAMLVRILKFANSNISSSSSRQKIVNIATNRMGS